MVSDSTLLSTQPSDGSAVEPQTQAAKPDSDPLAVGSPNQAVEELYSKAGVPLTAWSSSKETINSLIDKGFTIKDSNLLVEYAKLAAVVKKHAGEGWRDAMLSEFGESIRPHLEEIESVADTHFTPIHVGRGKDLPTVAVHNKPIPSEDDGSEALRSDESDPTLSEATGIFREKLIWRIIDDERTTLGQALQESTDPAHKLRRKDLLNLLGSFVADRRRSGDGPDWREAIKGRFGDDIEPHLDAIEAVTDRQSWFSFSPAPEVKQSDTVAFSKTRGSRFKGPWFRDQFPINDIPEVHAEMAVDIKVKGLLADRAVSPRVSLADDWDFDSITEAADILPWHLTCGASKGTPPLRSLVGVVHELESELLTHHPNLSAAAVVPFWESWQVHDHIDIMCQQLMAGGSDPVEVEAARAVLMNLIGAYIARVRATLPKLAPAPKETRKSKRGRRVEEERHKLILEVANKVLGPRWKEEENWEERLSERLSTFASELERSVTTALPKASRRWPKNDSGAPLGWLAASKIAPAVVKKAILYSLRKAIKPTADLKR